MTKFIFFLLCVISAIKCLAQDGGCLKLDIFLVGDYSSSVIGHQRFVVDAFEAFASKFEVSEDAIKIGVMTFDDNAYIQCPLTSDPGLLKLSLAILRQKIPQNTTNIKAPLEAAGDQLWANGRKNVRKIIILVSDGFHNGGGGLYEAADNLKKQGIVIATIAIDDGSWNKPVMEYLATPGFYVESSYGTLVDVLKSLDVCM